MESLWSAYSDAYHRGDIEWIKKAIYLLIIIAAILLIFLTKAIITLWIGKEIMIDNMQWHFLF